MSEHSLMIMSSRSDPLVRMTGHEPKVGPGKCRDGPAGLKSPMVHLCNYGSLNQNIPYKTHSSRSACVDVGITATTTESGAQLFPINL